MRISDWSSDGCSSDLRAMAISKYQSVIESSSINGANAPYVEAYYEQFLDDPESIDPSWRAYFRLIQDQNAPREVPHSEVIARFERLAREPHRVVADRKSVG